MSPALLSDLWKDSSVQKSQLCNDSWIVSVREQGFQTSLLIQFFQYKIHTYFGQLLFFYSIYPSEFFQQHTKAVTWLRPVVLSDLWKDSSSSKVNFSASSKCLRIRALVVKWGDMPRVLISSYNISSLSPNL